MTQSLFCSSPSLFPTRRLEVHKNSGRDTPKSWLQLTKGIYTQECVDLLESRKDLQRVLNRQRGWAEARGMKFNKAKCWVGMHLDHKSSRQHYRLGTECLEILPEEKELGVLANRA